MAPPPKWSSNAKGTYCEECPHADDDCILRGLWNRTSTLTLLVDAPASLSVEQGHPLRDPNEQVVNQLLKNIGDLMGRKVAYNVIYLTGASTGRNPTKEVITKCSNYAKEKLIQAQEQFLGTIAIQYPHQRDRNHVVVPMGKIAMQALLPKVKRLRDVRGRRQEIQLGGYTFQVIPTFSRKQLSGKPGYARVMRFDIAKAFKLSLMSGLKERPNVETLTENYRIPKTIEEVREVCDHILAYTAEHDIKTISVDIETNTLNPYEDTAHTSVVSFAWAKGEATAILLDHPRSYYDANAAWTEVERVLESPLKKTFHNARFDLQFLRNRRGLRVPNVCWDTLLAEHFIDEDKSGVYALKQVIALYAPAYVGYEDEVRRNFVSSAIESARQSGGDESTAGPDCEKAWDIMTFYADLDYTPISTQDLDWSDLEDVRKELFEFEVSYLDAHRNEEKKEKSRCRSRIRARCKKYKLDIPSTVKTLTFDKGANGFDDIPVDLLLWYAAVDADVTRIVAFAQRALLRKKAHEAKSRLDKFLCKDVDNVMSTLYLPGTESLSNMSYTGTKLDFVRLEQYEQEISELRDKSLSVVQEMTCMPKFNPNSNDEMAHLVRNVLDVDPESYVMTSKGNLSVTDGWLKTQQRECSDPFTQEVIYYIRIYKKAAKTVSSFLKKFRTLAAADGRIHTSFNLNGTATGRLSSSAPNLQNVPLWMCRFPPHPDFTAVSSPGWNIKALFIPSRPDRVYFQLDIKAAEIRVLCAYAKDERLIQALIDGQDIHSFIAAQIFDPTYEEFVAGKDSNPELKLKRTATKRVVFGMIYGAGPYTIAEQIYGGLSTDAAEKSKQIAFAQEVMDLLFDRFPKIQAYISSTSAEVQKYGQVRTFFGRRRRLKLYNASWRERRKSERQAVNFKIQSSASDIVLSQLCAIEQSIHEIGGEVLLTVHDSIAGEIDRDRVPEMRAFFDQYVVDEVARKFDWLPVPFEYDLELGPNYGEMLDYGILESEEKDLPEKVKAKAFPLMERAQLSLFTDLKGTP